MIEHRKTFNIFIVKLSTETWKNTSMMTSSNGNIFRVTGHWRGALRYFLICVWINDWVNNREAGDLRRYRAHYDVIAIPPVRDEWKINRRTRPNGPISVLYSLFLSILLHVMCRIQQRKNIFIVLMSNMSSFFSKPVAHSLTDMSMV